MGLLEAVRAGRRLVLPPTQGVPFMPCTPHLLIAVNAGLDWCVDENIAEASDYLEFGVFRGFTLWYAQALARARGIQDMRFFGFDSFQGLPSVEDDNSRREFQAGSYRSPRAEVELFLDQY